MAESLQLKLKVSTDAHKDVFEVVCARVVRIQLGLMLECLRTEFCWLKNVRYEVGVMCPVCCQGGVVNYCPTHYKQGCEQEECLHFWSECDLRSATKFVRCQEDRVEVKQFAPWFATLDEKVNTLRLRHANTLYREIVFFPVS